MQRIASASASRQVAVQTAPPTQADPVSTSSVTVQPDFAASLESCAEAFPATFERLVAEKAASPVQMNIKEVMIRHENLDIAASSLLADCRCRSSQWSGGCRQGRIDHNDGFVPKCNDRSHI